MSNELNPSPGPVAEAKEMLVKDIGAVVGDTGDLVKAAAKSTVDSINATAAEMAAARSRLAENLHREKTRLVEAGTNAFDKVKCTAQATDDYVKQHPWPVLCAVAAAGLLAGVLLSRR